MSVIERKSDGIRKAAILIRGLDPATAAELLGGLDFESRNAIRKEMLNLDHVSEEQLEESVTEFIRSAEKFSKQKKRSPEPIARNVSLHSNMYDSPDVFESSTGYPESELKAELKSVRMPKPEKETVSKKSFGFLERLESGRIMKLLANERAQVIALVLSRLQAETAGAVLSGFDERLQEEIVDRMLGLDDFDEEVLSDIESALRERLESQVKPNEKQSTGKDTVQKILSFAGENVGKNVREKFVTEIEYEFGELSVLEPDEWAIVFKSVDRVTALVSLIGADREVLYSIFSQFKREEELALARELRELGPVDPEDAEEARKIIVRKVVQLMDKGAISPI